MKLEIRNLDLVRGNQLLQSKISFQIVSGEALWVQGQNGVGKSTLLESICGFRDYHGEVLWNEQNIKNDPDDFHEALSYIGHKNGNASALSLYDALSFYGHVYGSSQADLEKSLKKMGLTARKDVPVHMLSAGQQKRLSLARLILHKSKIWILDEPSVSLDISGVELLKRLVGDHLAGGGIVMYSSHVDLGIKAKDLHLQPIERRKMENHDSFLGDEWAGAL